MKRGGFAIAVIALAAVAFADDKPKMELGQTVEEEVKGRSFKLRVRTLQTALGNSRNYYLDLEHDKVLVSDSDVNNSTIVNVNHTLGLEVRKAPEGVPSRVTATVNKCVYHDLNCDGEWDAWYDGRADKFVRYIRHNDQWVPVCNKIGDLFRTELSFDRKTEYVWDGKVWQAKRANP